MSRKEQLNGASMTMSRKAQPNARGSNHCMVWTALDISNLTCISEEVIIICSEDFLNRVGKKRIVDKGIMQRC